MMATERRTTLRDIAARAGVHLSTAARALKNDERLTEGTRQRIQAIARELDYSPDPAVTALAAYRSRIQKGGFCGTVVWLTTHPTRDGWRSWPDFPRLFEGAAQRAKELGYTLEETWLRDLGSTPSRASDTLSARGIAGILVAPAQRHRARINLDWRRFSALSLSHSIAYPKLHLATNHQYRSMLLLMRKLRQLGYRRIALTMATDERVDHNWLGSYLVEQRRLRVADRVPVYSTQRRSRKEIGSWLLKHKPDVIVTLDRSLREVIREIGWAVPRDVGLAYPDCDPESEISGVTQNFQKVGEVAFNYLVDMLHRGERGSPAIPVRLLVEGTWVQGDTVRRLNY